MKFCEICRIAFLQSGIYNKNTSTDESFVVCLFQKQVLVFGTICKYQYGSGNSA